MKKVTPRKQIADAADVISALMREHLGYIADNLIEQVMKRAKNLTPSTRLNAIKDLSPKGQAEYRATMIELMSALSTDAIDLARKEVPKAKKVKLGEYDKLTPTLQKKIKTRTQLLIGKQLGDLMKVIEFAYADNEDTTDSDAQVEQDIRDSAVGWLDGTSVSAGAHITAATVISDARDVFFDDPEVSEEIEAFEFVNGDPVTPICTDLAGTIFDKDDPDRFRYTPPLHWNCKSWIRPILKGNLGNKEITKLKPSSKKLDASIQFDEGSHTFCECRIDRSDPTE